MPFRDFHDNYIGKQPNGQRHCIECGREDLVTVTYLCIYCQTAGIEQLVEEHESE